MRKFPPTRIGIPLALVALLLACWLPLSPALTPVSAVTALEARNKTFKMQSEAMKLYREGEYKKAIEVLREVANISLNSFLAHFYLGLSLIADRQYFEAVEPLKIALELEPGHIQAHIAMGDAYLKLGDLIEARAEYQRALSLQDNYAPAFEGLGRLSESEGNDREAIVHYQKALELNMAFPEAYGSLGELYLRQGRLEAAVELLLQAIEVKPDYALGYTRLGIAYSRLGLTDQAIAAINRAKALSPNDPRPYFSLADIYLDLGNLRRAEAEITTGIPLDPAGHTGPLLRARLRVAHQDLPGAMAALEAALAGEVQEVAGERELQRQLEEYRSMADRIRELRLAVGHDIGQAEPYLELAELMERMGALGRAVELARRAAEIRPDDATRFEWGCYLLKAEAYGEALPLFEELAQRGSRPALLNAGMAQAALGRFEQALGACRKYVSEFPQDPLGHLCLGNNLLRLGRAVEAETSYQRYLDLISGDEKTGKVRRLVRLLEEQGGGS